MERTVIRNAVVLSMSPAIDEHLDADVLIEGAKLAAVRPNIDVKGADAEKAA